MMNFTTNITDEDGWQIISTDWRRIPFEDISWAYQPLSTRRTRCKALCRPVVKLSHLADKVDESSNDSEQELLNPDLPGIEAACDALISYEADSGFRYKFCLDLRENEFTESARDIPCQIDEKEVLVSKEKWNEMVQNLTGDFTEERDNISSSGSDSSSLTSSLMLDFSDWEFPNHVSMPSTPKPRPYPYGTTRSSPSVSPPLKLNAFASSFTPSGSSVPSLTFSNNASPLTTRSSPSPTLHDFVFPSLNPSNPSVYPKLKIEKDDQGFYTNIEAEIELSTPKSRMTPSTLLPAFLQDDHTRRKGVSSRTRALVDRLRSRQSVAHEGSGSDLSSSSVDPRPRDSQIIILDGSLSRSRSGSRVSTHTPTTSADDNDGWIGLEKPLSTPPKSQKRHGPKLSASTTSMHRRTGSGPAALETEPEPRSPTSPPSQEVVLSSLSLSSSSNIPSSLPPTPPVVTNDDGWIDVSEVSHKYKPKVFVSNVPAKTLSASLNRKTAEPLTFPTLNAPPPSSSRSSHSHVRSKSTASSSLKRSMKASHSSHAGIAPLSVLPNYYVPFSPAAAVPVAVNVPYAPYGVNPMMPYATMTPQYQHHRYEYQRHPQQYTYHQRAHSVAIPTMMMPAGYVKPAYTVPNASPMTIRPGMW
ncbi:hypothetical protein GGU11DRAFT_59992 [Lentinula aff. detonsa]|uniref:Uncharacterized protein n=1 Tax=Lentinula aff. detonsa TaxID=2804958 RepID=A0AA38NQL2_9AGAR|nr:hypothetical protein GGU10DRAFT_343786 [Lentinula aff. detonsa]KAJ3797590.1 hypothetical protein GGU11DRAFT_59992 [Lentinula aff. detonsa]